MEKVETEIEKKEEWGMGGGREDECEMSVGYTVCNVQQTDGDAELELGRETRARCIDLGVFRIEENCMQADEDTK